MLIQIALTKMSRDDKNKMYGADDLLLWKKMKAGDRNALSVLFRRHYATLFDYAVKLSRQEELAKDSIQEIFLYLWEKRKTISSAQSIRAYLLVILRRQVLKSLKKNRAKANSSGAIAPDSHAEAFSPEDMLILHEQEQAEKRALVDALGSIPPRLREALYLKTYDGLKYHEIAAVMDVSPQVARNYISEAYQRLRKIAKKKNLLCL